MERDNHPYLKALLTAIENKLQWGKSVDWSSFDFEKLSELIFEQTKRTISENTLKRVWGRINYDSSPSDATLNTLSQFLGFKDFREFKIVRPIKEKIHQNTLVSLLKSSGNYFKSNPSIIFVSGALAMLILLIALSFNFEERQLNPSDFYFASRKVTVGLPNSVIFVYNAKKAPSNAKLEIQQSWDRKKRQTISSSDSLATSIYYDPGYFNAKLLVNGQIVKEHGLLIPSEGWKGKLGNSEHQVYFRDSSIAKDGKISIDKRLLAKSGFDENGTPFHSSFRYVDDFENLGMDDLIIETKIRNTTMEGTHICQHSSITLLIEGDAIRIPFSKKGCVAELELWHFDKLISGKNNDLSKLGVDFGDWVEVRFTAKDDQLIVEINDEKVLELAMNGRINKFHGLEFKFEGLGEIGSLQIKNTEKTNLSWPPDSPLF